MNVENWLPIPGYEGLYEVSDMGRVCSLYHGRSILKPVSNRKQGYLWVGLNKNGIRKTYTVHKLVLLAFVGLCPEGHECCHRDDNPKNNILGNLRWDSRHANIQDAIRNGRNMNSGKAYCKDGHLLKDPNLVLSQLPKRRNCISCRYAAYYVRKHPEFDRKTIADAYYDRLFVAV